MWVTIITLARSAAHLTPSFAFFVAFARKIPEFDDSLKCLAKGARERNYLLRKEGGMGRCSARIDAKTAAR